MVDEITRDRVLDAEAANVGGVESPHPVAWTVHWLSGVLRLAPAAGHEGSRRRDAGERSRAQSLVPCPSPGR
jgi:hypothetical protein